MEHDLKVWPKFYEALVDGTKTFEYRNNDRDYAVNDILHLREWDPIGGGYTGRSTFRLVTYIHLVLPSNCIMSIVEGARVMSDT